MVTETNQDTTYLPAPVEQQPALAQDEVGSPEQPQKETPVDRRVVEISAALLPAYQRAGSLQLTEKETEQLIAPFPDDIVEIRPNDGLIYIPHIFISDRLTRIFGPGQWTLIRRREWYDPQDNILYAEYVLVIRGCMIGEAVAGHPYVAKNKRMDYSDALEATAGIALRRIAGKVLACGNRVWQPEYARTWVSKYAMFDRRLNQWHKKASSGQASSHVAAAAPGTTAPAQATKSGAEPQVPAGETPEEKRQRWIKLCRETAGGKDWIAEDVLKKFNWLAPDAKLDAFALEAVPQTKKQAEQMLEQIKLARDAVSGPEIKASVASDAPAEAPAEAPAQKEVPAFDIVGLLKHVKEQATKTGKQRAGLLILSEGKPDVWINTFDLEDIATAKRYVGQNVVCRVTENQYGYRLVRRGIVLDIPQPSDSEADVMYIQ